MKLSTVKAITLTELKALSVHDVQRKINSANVRHYTECMQAHGFLSTHPIVWFKHQGKKMIVFGHHRREAAINAKCGAYAVEMTDVSMDETITLMRAENWATWKVRETVAMEIRIGNPHYVKLMEYVKAGISVAAASSILSGGSAVSTNYLKHVKAGTFRVRTTENADKILQILTKLPKNQIVRNGTFIKAISRCLLVHKFDSATFLRKLILNPGALERRSTIADFTDVIETIYNHASRNPLPLRFLADQAAKERNIALSGKAAA